MCSKLNTEFVFMFVFCKKPHILWYWCITESLKFGLQLVSKHSPASVLHHFTHYWLTATAASSRPWCGCSGQHSQVESSANHKQEITWDLTYKNVNTTPKVSLRFNWNLLSWFKPIRGSGGCNSPLWLAPVWIFLYLCAGVTLTQISMTVCVNVHLSRWVWIRVCAPCVNASGAGGSWSRWKKTC